LKPALTIVEGKLAPRRLDADGAPLPTAPRAGLTLQLRCRSCPHVRIWRIRRVTGRSFYASDWGAPHQRFPIGRWEAWLDALMKEGELRLVDDPCVRTRLRLVKGG
jgi:hypothetical protein